ncbi:NAD(P)-binding protein [Epithele typhae]|uniref:NAD(P)-binding protein n=1 Tax=Epithele typhae TaxID=378194 RepID=UPI00200833C0|nr:NAD(P)-binding protein [Epithele typhae]KAH9933632.1 NAD(P)-binding protein [Epithele typhae]
MSNFIAVDVFAAIGVALLIPKVYGLTRFVWTYYLRPSSIKRYLHGERPYALVTGATDGIGSSVAAELLKSGFNIIIHGRSEVRMEKAVARLRQEVPSAKDLDIKYFLADASKSDLNFETMIAPFKDLHITWVLHNVGNSDTTSERLDERPQEYIIEVTNRNALFATHLIRVLLPTLRRAASAGGPVLVQFTGSITADIAPARLPIYAASKGYLRALARGLDNDELYFSKEDGAPTGVRFAYLAVGGVHCESHLTPMPVSLVTPHRNSLARNLVRLSGAQDGSRVLAPWHVHAMVRWASDNLLPAWILDNASAEEMKTLIEAAKRNNGAWEAAREGA